MAGTLESLTIGSPNSTQDPKIKANFETLNNKLNSENKLEGTNIVAGSVGNTQLASAAKPFDWYAPKVIATEETRENTSFGTLTTADEIKEVVLPENGLIVVGYQSIVKSSVSAAGRVGIFLGANQLKQLGSAQEKATEGTGFKRIGTTVSGLTLSGVETAFATTGETLSGTSDGGVCFVFAAAGTYDISVKFKATSGSVTAKERKLWVGVMGV